LKIVRLRGSAQVEVVEAPDPEPKGSNVVVKVMASSICGTERHFYEDGPNRDQAASGVMNTGHEATGIVFKALTTSRLKEGDRVNLFASLTHCGKCRYCRVGRWVLCDGEPRQMGRGFHAELVSIREDFCLPLPPDISFETGALFSDVLGTALHAIRRLRITALDTVLVMGQGPIGLAATMICRFFGASVIAADTNPYRLDLALRCGATAVLDRGQEVGDVTILADSRGVDVAIDCAGAQASRHACLRAVRVGGRVAFVGLGQGFALDQEQFRHEFFRKDLELIASWYSDPSDMLELEQMVRRGLDPGRMVTHNLPLERAEQGYSAMFGGTGGKVILRPNGTPAECVSLD
jgi:L-iditol 2-dehydrogenase